MKPTPSWLKQRAALFGFLLVLLALTGCGAAPSVEQPSPTPSVTASGLSLRESGFSHAPEAFTIPGNVAITRRVDQPNVVTALFSHDDGVAVLAHLTQQLPAMGFTIDRSGGDSLLFSNAGWDGAFTVSPDISGLTLRRKPG